MMRINGRIRLSDLRSISQQEFDIACRICEEIRKIQESRFAYIDEHRLDPEIALPACNWAEDAENAIHDLYRFVATPTYDAINRLRFFTQPFTGYQLISFSRGHGKTRVPQIPDNFDEQREKLASRPDRWVHRYLLITRHLPTEMIVKAPKILGEIGWNVGGSPVNSDTYAYQERVNLLFEVGIINWLRKKIELTGSANILEIGGGYGGLAYHLKEIIPRTNYFICDIPEALLFSSLYLAISKPRYSHSIYDGTDRNALYRSDFGFKFIPNFMFHDLVATNVRIDLAINTLSFAEMSEKQVRYYGKNLKTMLRDTGVLFEQNFEFTGDPKKCLPDYFGFKKNIKAKSVPVLQYGHADLWANRRISGIIDPSFKPFDASFKPFGGPIWKMYWTMQALDRTRINLTRIRGRSRAWLLAAVKRLTGDQLFCLLKAWSRILCGKS